MAVFDLVCPVHGRITPRDIAVYGLSDVDAEPFGCRLPVVTRAASGRPTRIDWCGEPLTTVRAGGPIAPGSENEGERSSPEPAPFSLRALDE